jgi:hypothetical protein
MSKRLAEFCIDESEIRGFAHPFRSQEIVNFIIMWQILTTGAENQTPIQTEGPYSPMHDCRRMFGDVLKDNEIYQQHTQYDSCVQLSLMVYH